MRRVWILAVAFLFLPTVLIAGEPDYFTFKGGIYSPRSSDLEDFDTGHSIEVAYGHYIKQDFAIEGAIGHLATEGTISGYISGWYFSEKDEISAIPITITGKFIFPTDGADNELYGLVGAGLYYAKAKTIVYVESLGTDTDSDTITSFGFHIGMGLNINIENNMFIGLEGKYLWADTKFSGVLFGVPVEANADMDGIRFTGNIGFRLK